MHVARSMHPLSDKRTKLPLFLSLPLSRDVSRTHQISPLPPLLGPSLSPFSASARCLLYHPRVSFCRQMRAIRPMLNATFDSFHLRGAFHMRSLPSSSVWLRASLARRLFSLSLSLSCAQFMHLIRLRAFIARAHGLYRLVSITNGETRNGGVFGGKSDNEDTPAEDWCMRMRGSAGPSRNVRGCPANDGTAL